MGSAKMPCASACLTHFCPFPLPFSWRHDETFIIIFFHLFGYVEQKLEDEQYTKCCKGTQKLHALAYVHRRSRLKDRTLCNIHTHNSCSVPIPSNSGVWWCCASSVWWWAVFDVAFVACEHLHDCHGCLSEWLVGKWHATRRVLNDTYISCYPSDG